MATWSVFVIGRSTREQTIFNAVNILMGIGLLSIPLAFEYSGWIMGILLLLFSSAVTLYTARLLANCMQTDHSLLTYADVSWLAFGDRTRIIVSALFSFELMATCVASCLIFADSMHVLFPNIPVDHFKYNLIFHLPPTVFHATSHSFLLFNCWNHWNYSFVSNYHCPGLFYTRATGFHH